ncbi:nitrate reductase molybdenum cofactor assembly chaperone [Paraburkholderia terrae]|uniref:Respiratory nitrate reductase subunit n=1 Tax=Paraburkholderia terrae TaxID=311230 RepID=A0ABM7TME4_9BURK|nr:nitrate reductase molybdenum cofactor assembly chaperone [Paraburkholderia terrae]BCZ80288.1 respiratory nitrate reductase subunit [Paraburkholderia terrae]BDC41247.1 respiratory nitrate reductase subunit [Paraburkholderia terrae]
MGSRDAIPPGATYAVLGALLSYPDQPLLDALPEAQKLLSGERCLTRDARAGLDQFIDYCAQRDLFTLQENYVALFDRGRATSLYLFEHVHGESRDRGQAMVDLLRMYEEHGLHLGAGELPDYLPVFLEYLSRLPSAEARGLLAETGEILQSITSQLARRGSPFSFVVGALLPLAGVGKAEEPDTLNDDDAQSSPTPADYRALDAAWADEPVRFVGAATPAQAPIHFYDSRPGAASPAGRNATRENKS